MRLVGESVSMNAIMSITPQFEFFFLSARGLRNRPMVRRDHQALICYNDFMRTAKQTLDEQFLEMRWRCLSLAADMDRIHAAPGGSDLLQTDPRLDKLCAAIDVLKQQTADRAAQVQMIFSDISKVSGI